MTHGLFQDITINFVIAQYKVYIESFQGTVRNGFFVEAGADDFVDGSNT